MLKKKKHRLDRRSLKRTKAASRIAVALSIVATGMFTVLSAAPASAEVVRLAGIPHATTFMGVENFNGVVGVCSGNGRAVPSIVTPPTAVYSPTSAWVLNAVMSADGMNLDDDTAAAVATIVKNDPLLPSNHNGTTPDVGVNTIVNNLINQANTYAGPRSIPLQLATYSATPGMTWELTGVGVRVNNSGAWLPNRPMTLTISGPVVFDSTGTNTITLTSGSAPQTLDLTSTGNGAFTVSANASVPSNFVNSHPAQGSGYQIITTRVGNDNLSYSTDPVMAVFDFFPQAVTNTSIVVGTEPGVQLHDVIIVTEAKPLSTLTGRSTLYGPLSAIPTETATAPAGTPVVGTAEFELTVDEDGYGVVETSSLTIPASGYYVWQEEIDGDDPAAPSPKNYPFVGNYGVGTETTLISPEPSIFTRVNDQNVLVGTEISDDVTILGTVYDRDGLGEITNEFTGSLYGPMDPVEGECRDVDWTEAPIAHEFGPIAVSSTQQFFSGVGAFTPAELGCYSYAETFTSTDSQGNEIHRVEHPVGQVEQTTLVETPEAVTQISSYAVKPGEAFSDDVIITGTTGESGTFEATLWGPVTPDPVDACWFSVEDWAELIDSGEAQVFATETLTFTGDGTVTTSDVIVEELGCYTWSESFTFDNHPDIELETLPGEETETGIVMDASISTIATASSGFLGATFYDNVTLEGTQGVEGTITGQVLTAPAINNSCEDIDWVANGTVIGEIEPIATVEDGVYQTSSTLVDGIDPLCATFAIQWTPVHEKLETAAIMDPAGLPAETALFVPELPASPDEPRIPSVSAGIPSENGAYVLAIGILLMVAGAGTGLWRLNTVRKRS